MSILSSYPYLAELRQIAGRKGTKLFLVGGFLRDHLLKKQSFDLDFAVPAQALPLARAFARKIKGAFVLLDEGHDCARVVKKIKGQIYTYDFAQFRAKTLKGDLAHRDFTVNTLALDLMDIPDQGSLADQVIDHQNGRTDIRGKTIRMVSSQAFREDPLRLLRAFSLRAQLGFRIEKSTLAQIKKDARLIRDTAEERILEEMFKIFRSDRAGEVVKAMDRVNLLEEVIPQVRIMFSVKQGGYHHLGVWAHSLETLVQLEKILEEFMADADAEQYLRHEFAGNRPRYALMKLAAVLHDVGKPESMKKEAARLSFHGHERVGKNIVRSVARQMRLSTKERHALEDMVLWHLRPGYLSNFQRPTKKAVFRYFRDTQDEAVSTALLSLADQRSTRGPLTTEKDQRHHEEICRELVSLYFKKKNQKPFVRLINGTDLIKTLKLSPSPLFKLILDKVEENQALGKIKTKKDALRLAKDLAKAKKGKS